MFRKESAVDEISNNTSNKDIVAEVARLIASTMDGEEAVDAVLSYLGKCFGLQRAYIFENERGEKIISNTYEWVSAEMSPHISELQKLPYAISLGSDYFDNFGPDGMFLQKNIDELKCATRSDLKNMKVKSVIQFAMKDDGEYFGFIGFDSTDDDYDWSQDVIDTLWMCSRFLAVIIMKKRKVIQLSDSMDYLRALEDTNLYFYIVDSKTYEIKYVNKAIRDSMETEASGKCCYKAFMGLDEPCPLCPIYMRENWEVNYPQEVMKPDGRYFLSDASPIKWKGEDHYLVTCQDVTKYREEIADKEIENESLERANREKSSFLARMSHDIRTPINGIVGMSRMARDKSNDSTWVETCLDKIDASAKHLSMLVNDMLDLSKIESGNITLRNVPTDLKKICDSCLVILNGMLIGRQLKLVVNSEYVEEPVVYGDELYLRQIIVNIMSNAIKFTHDGGCITMYSSALTMSESTDVLFRLSIEDTGIGMSKEFLKHVFEPFSQADERVRSEYKGSGLGMPIVKQLTELMGGKVIVESEQGLGTKVTIEVPFKRVPYEEIPEVFREDKGKNVYPDKCSEPEKADEEGAAADEKEPLDGMRILLAEDNELNLEIEQYVLSEAGAVITSATNGCDVVRIFEESEEYSFDTVIMDIMMPGLNGYEATRKIRSLKRADNNVPIIAASANSFTDDIEKSIKAGMNGHVSKPIEMDQLIRELSKFIHFWEK